MPNVVRQYVGARYTVKIYENSLDPSSAEWESGRSWEPLILVTYNNSSYLSKKEIPANIGNPAANPSYWVCTGYYNGEIISLQNQIDTINNTTIPGVVNDYQTADANLQTQINKCLKEDDLIVCVTDSYGNRPNNWMTYMASYLGIDSAHLVPLCAPGYGFHGDMFKDVITPGADTHSISADVDPLRVTKIIVCAGFNDRADNVASNIQSFMTYVKSRYTKAHVYIGFIGWSFNDYYLAGFSDQTGLRCYADCAQYGATYLNGVENIMKNKALFEKETPQPGVTEQYNYIHPNDDGEKALGRYIGNALVTGSCTISYPWIASYFAGDTDITPTLTFFREQVKNGEALIHIPINIGFTHATRFSINGGHTEILLAKQVDGDAYINPSRPIDITCPVMLSGDSLSGKVYIVRLRLDGNKISVLFDHPTADAGFCTTISFFAGWYRVNLAF